MSEVIQENVKQASDIRLRIVKTIVLIMTTLIFALGGFLVYALTKDDTETNTPKTASETTPKITEAKIKLENNTLVKSSFSCGKYLCVNVQSDDNKDKIFIINPENLSEIKTLKFD